MDNLKSIDGFEDYFVNELGQTFSKRQSGDIKKLSVRHHPTGYKYIGVYSINESGKRYRKWLRVHRVVYETFIGKIPQGYVIDHINGDKGDNRLENLQVMTHKENLRKHWRTIKNERKVD